jgi:hypothetical protein
MRTLIHRGPISRGHVNAEPVEDISEFAVFVRVTLADFNANQLVAGQAYFHDCAVEPVGDHPARLTVKLEDIFQSVDGLAKLQAVFTGLTAQQIDGLEPSLGRVPLRGVNPEARLP